jgi:ubiquinone/menaquinone biosynthesis C-methylase UbiE
MSGPKWNEFFRNEAPRYLENGFTRNTRAEADFIIAELGVKPGDTILDIGCGTGRHSIELASRGCRVTGIDQSPDMLSVARSIAREKGLAIEFFQGDASEKILPRTFDHAICICEGAFSLLEVSADPVRYHRGILSNIHRMLRSGGRFLLTALNGLRLIREHTDADIQSGHFDPVSVSHVEQMPAADGTVSVVEKGFTPAELKGLLEDSGFRVLSLWGGTAGGWNKEPLKLDEIEVMAISEKA